MSAQDPTQLIHAYLHSKGLPLSSENVRRVLEINQHGSSIIPGLINQTPPAPDMPNSSYAQAMSNNAPPQTVQGASGAPQSQLPLPPMPPPAPNAAPSAAPQAAAPQTENSGLSSAELALLIGGAGAAAGGGALAYRASGQPGAPQAAAQIPQPSSAQSPVPPHLAQQFQGDGRPAFIPPNAAPSNQPAPAQIPPNALTREQQLFAALSAVPETSLNAQNLKLLNNPAAIARMAANPGAFSQVMTFLAQAAKGARVP